MSDTASETISVAEYIDAYEREEGITPPFSADERALVRAVAEALYFVLQLMEMPARFPADDLGPRVCARHGITKIRERREAGHPANATRGPRNRSTLAPTRRRARPMDNA